MKKHLSVCSNPDCHVRKWRLVKLGEAGVPCPECKTGRLMPTDRRPISELVAEKLQKKASR